MGLLTTALQQKHPATGCCIATFAAKILSSVGRSVLSFHILCLKTFSFHNLLRKPQSTSYNKIRKTAKIRNGYNQVPHLTQDTNGKVTNSQLDITNGSQEVSPFPTGDHKTSINRHAHESITNTRQK